MNILLLGYCNGLGGGPTHFRLASRFLAAEGHRVLAIGVTGQRADLPRLPRGSSAFAFPSTTPTRARRLAKAVWFALLAARIRLFRPRLFIAVGYGNSYPRFARVAGAGAFRFYQDVWLAAHHPVRDAMTATFDAVAVQSPMMITPFVEVIGREKPVNWLPCFADTEPASTLARLPAPGERLRLGYFGRLASNKGLANLVDAVAPCEEVELGIFGDGPERAALEKRIAAAGVGARVKLHGPYPGGAAYRELLTRQHALVFASTHGEGLPLVLLEAMNVGLPILATQVGAVVDATRDNPDAVTTGADLPSLQRGLATLCRRLRAGDFDPARHRRFFDAHFSPAIFHGRWRTMLDDPRGFFLERS